jgi:hypothetical protein
VRTGSSPSNCFLSSRALSSSYENTKPVGLAGGALAPDCDWDRSSPADGVESLAIDPDPCPCCTQIHTLTSPAAAQRPQRGVQHAACCVQDTNARAGGRTTCSMHWPTKATRVRTRMQARATDPRCVRDCMPQRMPQGFGRAFERCSVQHRKTQFTECSA